MLSARGRAGKVETCWGTIPLVGAQTLRNVQCKIRTLLVFSIYTYTLLQAGKMHPHLPKAVLIFAPLRVNQLVLDCASGST